MMKLTGKSRTIRIALGIVILAAGFVYKSWWGAVGILPILGGLCGYCFLGCCSSKTGCCGGEPKKDAGSDEKKGGCCSH